jgi:DNA invertase Pin-like site-specific DNA recombinase
LIERNRARLEVRGILYTASKIQEGRGRPGTEFDGFGALKSEVSKCGSEGAVMTKATKRVALYLRVSTTGNGQTTLNQQRELEAVAARSGWRVVRVFEDNGISGAKGRDRRPGLDALLKAATRREFDLIAAWSVDRLGRSLPHLVQLFSELQAHGVDLYLHQQHVDSSTPAGNALLQMSAVFAEFERAMLRERVAAGLARAVAQGRQLGRPRAKGATDKRIRALRAQGLGMVAIARRLRCGGGTVWRALREDGAG